MGTLSKRILSLLLALVMCFSLFSISAAATFVGGSGRGDFFTWADGFGGGSFGGGAGREESSTAYDDYVTTLQDTYGSVAFGSDGGYWLPIGVAASQTCYITIGNGGTRSEITVSGGKAAASCNDQYKAPTFYFPLTFPTVPCTGTLYYHPENVVGILENSEGFSIVSNAERLCYVFVDSSGESSARESFLTSIGLVNGWSFVPSVDKSWNVMRFASTTPGPNTFRMDLKSLNRLLYFKPAVSPDITSLVNTRVGTLNGDYIGEGGAVYENVTIVDELNNTFYNPVTGDTYNISNWTYDYSDRSYHITIDNSQTVNITYGDEYVTIQEGDTITNIYYGVPPGEGGGTTDPEKPEDKETIWDKLGNLVGGALNGLITLIETAVMKVLDGLIALIEGLNKKLASVLDSIFGLFDRVPQIFGGFTGFLTAVFPFFPQEVFDILIFGVLALVAAALIKSILKR